MRRNVANHTRKLLQQWSERKEDIMGYRLVFHINKTKSTVSLMYFAEYNKSCASLSGPREFIRANGRLTEVSLYALLPEKHEVEDRLHARCCSWRMSPVASPSD